MKKALSFSFLIFLMANSFSSFANVNERRQQLVNVINEELSEVNRLNSRTKGGNPDLLLRSAELLLEKARLIKEQENLRFLTLSPKRRRSLSKKKFYSKSRSYFLRAQKYGQLILKKFRRYKNKGDVYYILAYNYKEFGNNAKAKKYFLRAAKTTSKKSMTGIKSRIALAEIYFNKGKFNKALPLYKQSLSNPRMRDKWYTKDAYNMAWCYFRTKNTNKAISTLKEVHRLSKNPNYVDMSFSIERDLAYFYTEAGRTDEAISFYKKRGKNITKNLIKVAKNLVNQGKFSAAEKALSEALKHQRNSQEALDINLQLLSLYDRFGRYTKHNRASKVVFNEFKKGRLVPDQFEIIKYHVTKMSALLQKQVTSKAYRSNKKASNKKTKLAVSYFEMLSVINPKDSHKALFFAGETYYANGDFEKSLTYYERAQEKSKLINDKKIENLAFNAMMSALSSKKISKKVKGKYLEKVYITFLKRNPRGKKANTIFQRLFSIYYDKSNIKKAEATLLSYKKNFPRQSKTIEAMLARVMDYYKKKSNKVAIKTWVKRINSGEFVVSKKLANQVRLTLLTMQFSNIEKASSRGDKKNALKGYVELYRSPGVSREAKKNAAYNIAVLFHELGDPIRTYGWTKRSLSLMNTKDIKKFESSFFTIASDLFSRRKVRESVFVYKELMNKLCRTKSRKKKIFFKNIVVMQLSNSNLEGAANTIRKAYKCKIPMKTIRESEFDLLKAYGENQRWSSYSKLLKNLKSVKKLWPRLIFHYAKLANAYKSTGRISLVTDAESKMLKLYGYSKKRRMDIPLESLDAIAAVKLRYVKKAYERASTIQLRFPEKVFNKQLKNKFKKLDQLTVKAVAVLKLGSGKGMMAGYKYLVNGYSGLIKEIVNFRPAGKSKEYISSFKKSMRGLISQLQKKVDDFEKEARNQMLSSKILSSDNLWFTKSGNYPFRIQYFPSSHGIIMDRGGKQ